MEGQFGGSEGLSGGEPGVTIILWVWIYFLTSVPDVLPSALHLQPLLASISPPSVADNNEKAPVLNSHQLEPGDYKVPRVLGVFLGVFFCLKLNLREASPYFPVSAVKLFPWAPKIRFFFSFRPFVKSRRRDWDGGFFILAILGALFFSAPTLHA